MVTRPRRSRAGLWVIAPLLALVLASSWWASFHALAWVGDQLNIHPGWVFAVSADCTIGIGLAGLVIYATGGLRLRAVLWVAVGAGSVTSIIGNVGHAGTTNPWHVLGGAMPAVFLGISTEAALHVVSPT